ncbi:MAG: hypothetical protein K2K56_12880 [Lachnospiraceae bacterium]|nr:hypothetical protein [Lachnospiraceae bacterium]
MDKDKIRLSMVMLLKAAWKKQRFPVISIFLMMFVLSMFLFSSVTLYDSGRTSVEQEMNRLGFGDFTVWVSNYPEELIRDIRMLEDTGSVTVQDIIYAGYEINGAYSDNEGQLTVYEEAVPYQLTDENAEKLEKTSIDQGTIYVSPAMKSLYGAQIGEAITFELTRTGGKRTFQIAGYFEDAFMGSSMIDMKSFLISRSDYEELCDMLKTAGDNNALAKTGAMLHIEKAEGVRQADREFYQEMIEETELSRYTEFTYRKNSILSYMLLLQNILSGFLFIFSIILFLVCVIIVLHSMETVIEQEKKNMAILKTIGLPGEIQQRVYLSLYGGSAVSGALLGVLPCKWLCRRIAQGMITSTGMLIAIKISVIRLIPAFFGLAVFSAFIVWKKTGKILMVRPLLIIQETKGARAVNTPLRKRYLSYDMAFRALMANKKKYMSLFLIAVLLTFFLSMIGHMGGWLGRNGEGLMNAFSVAEHDLGVQPFHQSVPMDEIERAINWYSPVIQQYELAMESVTVNGQEYTANVLSDIRWFHVLRGRAPEGNEILITDTVAGELNVDIGDFVKVSAAGRTGEYQISGIYQCANGMGNNIGMSTPGYSQIGDVTGFIWCKHYILEEGDMRDYAYEYLKAHYKNIDVHTNSWSGLDGIVKLLHLMIAVIYMVSAGIILLATALVADKMILSEMSDLAVYRSMGFHERILRLSFALRFFIVAVAGAVTGTVLSILFSDRWIGVIFRSFGIGEFKGGIGLVENAVPLLVVPAAFLVFAWLYGKKLKTVKIIHLIEQNEE